MNQIDENAPHPADDLAAYALGALEPEEEARVREHLQVCERCRSELQWLRPAVDVLPASVPQVEPPRRLKRELMRTVRADAREERGGWWSRRAGWISMRARPAVAVGAVALLGAGIAGYAVNEANEASDEMVTFQGADSAVLERDGDEATLRVAGMAPLAAGEVYQLWYGDSAGVEPAKAFTVGEDGAAEADLGEIPAGTEELLVTKEDEPGLPMPEGEVLLSATLS
jgi:anti-sigma factor RsiW